MVSSAPRRGLLPGQHRSPRAGASDVDTGPLATLIPAGGLGTILLILVGYLLKQIPADRADYREDLAEERERTAKAEARTAAADARADAAHAQVDEERQQRRIAEAARAAAETKMATQQTMIAWYAAERAWLLPFVPAEVPPGVIPDAPREEE